MPADQFQVNDDGLLVWVGEGNSWKDGVAKGLWGTQTEINGRTYQWGHPIRHTHSTGNPAIVRIGDGNPDMHLGFSSNLRWKGLSVYALLDAQIGGDVYNRTNQ